MLPFMQQATRKKWAAAILTIGTATAGVALFSENLSTAIKNSEEILLTLGVIGSSSHSIPFEIIAKEPKFAVLGTVSGTATIEKPFLKLSTKAFTLRTQKEAAADVKYVRIGVAHQLDIRGAWDVSTWGEKFMVGQQIERNSSKLIPAFETVIPIDQLENLDGYWLVLEIGMGAKIGDEATTYAHSQRHLFRK
jgi:hypothetical protein